MLHEDKASVRLEHAPHLGESGLIVGDCAQGEGQQDRIDRMVFDRKGLAGRVDQLDRDRLGINRPPRLDPHAL